MARVATRKKETHALQEAAWRKLLETTDFAGLDADARADAWTVLAWAEKHAVLSTPPTPVPAEKAEMERVVAAVLALIATPPAGVDAAERIARAAGWAARTNHPLVHALHGVLCAENAQMKAALEVFEKLKCVGSAFPEVSLVVGRALLAQAGRDSKLLHRAEWWLQHAEHLHLDGDSEIEAEEDAENSDDPEPMEHEVAVDENAHARLAEIWALMATLYERLGDPRKSEMYRGRAGDLAEEREEPSDGAEAAQAGFVDDPALKAADRKLIAAFLQSPQYGGLGAAEQRQALSAVPTFVGLGRAFLGLAPTRIDRYSLEELFLALVPEKVVATLDELGRYPACVASWIFFLGKSAGLRDAGRLVPFVHRFTPDFMVNCRNKDCWGVPKTMAMRALEAGPASGAKVPA